MPEFAENKSNKNENKLDLLRNKIIVMWQLITNRYVFHLQ